MLRIKIKVMKKILFVLPVLVLIAAGCNSSYQAQTTAPAPVVENTNPSPTPSAEPTATPFPTTANNPAAAQAPSMAPEANQTKPPQATIVLKLGSDASHGQYLTATNGMTLYTSSKDSANVSNCTGACASNWPPYTTPTATLLGGVPGISASVAAIVRADGSKQITYKGLPLYFWASDQKPGDTTGDGIGGFAIAKP